VTPSRDDDTLEKIGENGAGTEAARQVKQILEAAERAAEAVREKAESEADAVRREAEEEAKSYLADYRRRVDELDQERARVSETLVQQAGKMREQYNRFLDTLDGALKRASETGADLGLIESLRRERDAAKDLQDSEPELSVPGPDGSGESPEPSESPEPRRKRLRWPLDPFLRRREPTPQSPGPSFDPRRGRDDGGGSDDDETLPGGYRPR
jgi:hypothetical protein